MRRINVVIIGLLINGLATASVLLPPAAGMRHYHYSYNYAPRPYYNPYNYVPPVRVYPPCANSCRQRPRPYQYYGTYWDPISNRIYPGLNTVEVAEWLDPH
jgi:hypothetical protein